MGGVDSKEAFKLCVEELRSREGQSLQQQKGQFDKEFWAKFWTLPTSVEEVYELLSPEEVRRLKREAPCNFAILLTRVVNEMRKVVAQGASNTPKDFTNVLNCTRLLTRMLPLVLEDQSDDFFETVFWRNELPASGTTTKRGEEKTSTSSASPAAEEGEQGDDEAAKEKAAAGVGTLVEEPEIKVEGEEEEAKDGQQSKGGEEQETPNLSQGDDGSDPLAIRLLNAVVNLLFYPNFTVSPRKSSLGTSVDTLPLDQVWIGGIGVGNDKVLPTTRAMLSNRTEILRLLLVLFSEALYHSPEETGKYVNKWLDIVACNASFHSRAIFYSLMNSSFTYDPIGWGMPYNHVLFRDEKEALADICLQVLCVLLNHEPSALIPRGSKEAKNIFIEYLQELDKHEDFEFFLKALVSLLSNPLVANNTYLPHSTKQISCHQEMLMLFWKTIQVNRAFCTWLVTKSDVTQVIDPILHFLHEARKDSAQNGLVSLGTFILLFLSGEREFVVQLNKPFTRKLTITLPTFTGNYADYLILVLHKMLVDGHSRLESLFECFFTIIANISPYIKNLSMTTSMKLLSLFKTLSRPKFLLAAENNHRYLYFLLEIFNNFIQYQYEGNYRLIYAFIRNRELFRTLSQLTFSSARQQTTKSTEQDEEKNKDKEQETQEHEAKEENEEGKQTHETEPTQKDGTTPETQEAEEEKKDEGEANEEGPKAPPAPTISMQQQTDRVSFQPTEEWLEGWRQQLPLTTILRLLDAIMPQLPEIVSGTSDDEALILSYLKNTTMVGLLPVPHPILIRRYQSSAMTDLWFSTFMWGVVYLRNNAPPIFWGTQVKLFMVKLLGE